MKHPSAAARQIAGLLALVLSVAGGSGLLRAARVAAAQVAATDGVAQAAVLAAPAASTTAATSSAPAAAARPLPAPASPALPTSASSPAASARALPPSGPLVQTRDNLVFDGVPPGDPRVNARLADYLHGRDATFLDWLPDGSMLVSTRFGDTPQVHRVLTPLGMREQLTYYPEPITTAIAPPTGSADGFAFLKDHSGDEVQQLYYYDLADRSARMLTDGSSLHGSPVWSRDGKHIVFFGTGRDGSTYDIYEADIGAGTAPHLVVAGRQLPWYPLDWSADGRKLLLWQHVSSSESYLYIADVNTGSVMPVDTSGRHVGILSARFAPDGHGLYLTSDEGGEFAQLRYLDLDTHQLRDVTANVPWDIEDFDVSADGRYLAYVIDDGGHSRLTVLDTRQRLELSPSGLPEGRIGRLHFDPSSRLLGFSAEGPQSPRDVYVYAPEHNQLQRWTHSEPGALDPAVFVAAQAIQYPTWDRTEGGQRMIPAFLYRPRTSGPHPVLIELHDGPEGQFRPGFDPFIQFVVNELGYVVIAPNVRGSQGYGKSYRDLDNGPLRDDAIKDVGALLVWVGQQPGLDRSRVVVMGHSYGGFLALATLAAYGDRLRGGIDIAGIASLPDYVADAPAAQRPALRAEFGDERDPQMRSILNRLSPLNNLAQIRRPLLVVQGLNDSPERIEESRQIVADLRARGGEAWYLAAKDEGRDINRKLDRDAWLATAAQFLQRLAK